MATPVLRSGGLLARGQRSSAVVNISVTRYGSGLSSPKMTSVASTTDSPGLSLPILARAQLVDSGGNILAIGLLHASFNASGQMSAVPGGWQYAPAMIMLILAVMVIARCLAVLSPAGLPQRGRRPGNRRLMRKRGVQIESWGPFAEGRNNLFTDPTLTAIGEAHGKSVAQVVLRWLIQREVVAIPKSVRKDRIDENIDVFDFELTQDEMSAIAAMDQAVTMEIYANASSAARREALRRLGDILH
jgi:hypothetical protein